MQSSSRPKPRIVVVSSTEGYRHLAASEVREGDHVMEIGCSAGEATKRLVRKAAKVLAVDVSVELVERLRDAFVGIDRIHVAVIDGRDVDALKELMPTPDLIFVDVGGNALLPNVCTVVGGCISAFHPRLIVVRSFELARLASAIEWVEQPGERFDDVGEVDRLIHLSRSYVATDRAFAARRLALIGGSAALDRLAEMVDDSERRVRRSARKAIDATRGLDRCAEESLDAE